MSSTTQITLDNTLITTIETTIPKDITLNSYIEKLESNNKDTITSNPSIKDDIDLLYKIFLLKEISNSIKEFNKGQLTLSFIYF